VEVGYRPWDELQAEAQERAVPDYRHDVECNSELTAGKRFSCLFLSGGVLMTADMLALAHCGKTCAVPFVCQGQRRDEIYPYRRKLPL
jgi:hypothetical protein